MKIPTFREVTTPEEWARAVELRNELLWQRPVTLEEVQDWVSRMPEGTYHKRCLMTVDGEDIGTYNLTRSYWMDAPGRFEIHAHSADPDYFDPLLAEAVRSGEAVGASKLGFWARTDRPEQQMAAVNLGFTIGQINPEVGLDLTAFPGSDYNDLLESLKGQGFVFRSYQEHALLRPKTWIEEVWRLENDILNDVPFPDPHREDTLEEFQKVTESPFMRFDSMFLAEKDGVLAGMSQLTPNRVDDKVMSTGLTGVRRPYRRIGLATALKALALTWAQEQGARWVFTDNEENNPMYDLNLKLGFTKQFEWVCCEKTFTSGTS